jgi:hypothetical protein
MPETPQQLENRRNNRSFHSCNLLSAFRAALRAFVFAPRVRKHEPQLV